MLASRKLLAALALFSALTTLGQNAQASPGANMTPLPGLAPLSARPLAMPVTCRPYEHCHSRCVRWRWGKCRRSVRYCHTC